MFRPPPVFSSLAVLLLLAAASPLLSAQPKHEKTVWNFDGGISLITDGSIPDGPCFRLTGRVFAPEFFENLKRVDSELGTVYRRGNDVVSVFPEKMQLDFMMYDMPCSDQIQAAGTRVYLTRALMETLRLSFFWKHGMYLRPAKGVTPKHLEARPVPAYGAAQAKDLPEKSEWWFEFEVPSENVPVTDSLVILVRTPDGYIAARVAARM
ncbi:MAG: hypothetical protein ABSG77_16025 [Candidatus Acidiferrum sp.]|jgi:hypothetical protein